jgi:hypothetical protein
MTNTVFKTFQTQYILDFSSASHSETLGFVAILGNNFPHKVVSKNVDLPEYQGTPHTGTKREWKSY